jgi:hypothetical protein
MAFVKRNKKCPCIGNRRGATFHKEFRLIEYRDNPDFDWDWVWECTNCGHQKAIGVPKTFKKKNRMQENAIARFRKNLEWPDRLKDTAEPEDTWTWKKWEEKRVECGDIYIKYQYARDGYAGYSGLVVIGPRGKITELSQYLGYVTIK